MSTTLSRISDADKAEARANVAGAFSLAGLVGEKGTAVCPSCATDRPGKVKLFSDGGWHCFRCAAHGDSIGLLMQHGWSFPDAVAALCGRPVRNRPVTTTTPAKTLVLSESFTATLDVEVYAAVMAAGSVDAAAAYYARFGIAAAAVAEAGAVRVLDPVALERNLRARFGDERLVACGLAVPANDSRPLRILVSRRYPVVEPHRLPDGTVVGMQMRASEEQAEKIAAHKAGDGSYVPKFLGLRGAGDRHLVGCGLPRLASLPAGSTIRVVEGFKDLLAARSLGWEAYALPGAGTTPPPVALEILKRHNVQLCLDGDDAGAAGAERLTKVFTDAGITTRMVKLPRGRDVADLLGGRR